ncbi:nucleotide exchange factor GrpE [Pandoraea nosoerga]|uniref:Protein GrpE n=1 Tax=Pandoraea nosoerga TaxID=2508296 RepID=A0A5E4WV85_9BURK|nr:MULTISPECIES: nucleotide exchange factor GrpE [Pandoraea]MBN4665574.1 nucleotide exchange factor GrpE [Pandoraea nosoerga]MBN4675901.1 nucleotide exchange factor GrpE [Pandoraea nosoerga]MBN4680891.1 nucleotide exchange factor GrpE [Pandoraea nosoerga]MBN4744615.1 nucleotide exchange factor GrpE [Pandoraea nosoerga]VVE26816.1 nucleotide exchange factor GrpE [Pandoraea nosoerga]
MTEQQNTPDQPIPSQADTAPNDAAGANDALPSVEAQLLAAQAEAADFRDQLLRARAEVENVRRRAEEDVAKARKFAVESFAEGLLPVMDSLEAAAADKSGDVAKLQEGVELTLRQLVQALERGKVKVIDPAGAKFDPHQHQAISMVPADQEPNTVVTVLQKGYLIADRVLRPALVTVAAAK